MVPQLHFFSDERTSLTPFIRRPFILIDSTPDSGASRLALLLGFLSTSAFHLFGHLSMAKWKGEGIHAIGWLKRYRFCPTQNEREFSHLIAGVLIYPPWNSHSPWKINKTMRVSHQLAEVCWGIGIPYPKLHGWKINFSFWGWRPIFSGKLLVSGRVA